MRMTWLFSLVVGGLAPFLLFSLAIDVCYEVHILSWSRVDLACAVGTNKSSNPWY
jgi:hypothetical protein